jgi:phosphoribosylformylglycinamidine cyclo-ligase
VKPVRSLLESVAPGVVHGLANITGGGLPDNIGRILPPGKRVRVKRGSWPVPPVFGWLQTLGNVADAEMFRVFNMGVGFAVVCEPAAVATVVAQLAKSNLPAWKIGDVADGEVGVEVG